MKGKVSIENLILKEWFNFLGAATFILFLLLSIANLITGLLRSNVTALEVLLNHFIEMPGSAKLILPVACLIASLFSIAKLKNRNELTAIFASGFSRKRYMLTLLKGALIVGGVQLVLSGFIDPIIRKNRDKLIDNSERKFKNLKKKGLRSSTIGSGKIWYKGNNYIFSFAKYERKTQELLAVTFYQTKNNLIESKIEASKIHFNGQAWIAKEALVYSKVSSSDEFTSTQKIKDFQTPLEEVPSDFSQIEADITTLSLPGLFFYIQQLKSAKINTDEYEVTFYEKISSALLCLIFTLLAAVSIFNPNRRSSSFGKSVIFIFAFTLLYWLINSYFVEMGKGGKIPAALACFIVPILFMSLLSYLFYRNRRLV